MFACAYVPLVEDERREPAADDEQERDRAAGEADEAGDHEPFDDAQAPEVLLDPLQLQVQVMPVEVDVLVQRVEGGDLLVRAGGEHAQPARLEERQVAEAPVLPERERQDGGSEPGEDERRTGRTAPVGQPEQHAGQEDRFAGLIAIAVPAASPHRERRSCRGAR